MEAYALVSEIVMVVAVAAAILFLAYLLRVIVLDELRARRRGRRLPSCRVTATPPSPLGRRVALLLPHWLSRP
jgi:hypothetical protein